MTHRPLVSTFSSDSANTLTEKQNVLSLPGVFKSPIRPDIVQFVHDNLAKNTRQAHGVDPRAGMKHAAESWGTGRAVARIPRVSGSGTHRAGQGAFGNMCRKGRMFAPLKTWRKWHRKVNLTQRRHALASALAASAVTAIVMSRGHLVDKVPELPLVVDDKLDSYEKTKDAVAFLKRFGAYDDVLKVVKSKSLRAGIGKLRNRRYKTRRGPLVVYSNANAKLVKAFRNIPGVEVCNVFRLNLRQVAPGGQLGRFIIWTQSAFKALDQIFGSYRKTGTQKTDYQLQRPTLSNADIARVINSNEVQSVLKPMKKVQSNHIKQKKNPLTNYREMCKLNPYNKERKTLAKKAAEANKQKRQDALKQGRGTTKQLTAEQKKNLKLRKKNSKKFITNILNNLEDSFKRDIKQEKLDKLKREGKDADELVDDE